MKKQIITSTFVLSSALLLMVSCKKDYTCTCKGQGNGTNNTYYEASSTFTYEKAKEEDAKSSCTGNQSTLSQQNGGITINCSLSQN